MKKHIFLLLAVLFPIYLEAQNVCYIKYTYDASGNRVQREFFCGKPDVDDGSVATDPNDDPPHSRPASIVGGTASTPDANDFDFMVSPNPSDGKYQVQILDKELLGSTLEVLDGRGANVLLKKLDEMQFCLDITHFSNGTYYFYIRKDEKVKTKKVIKR